MKVAVALLTLAFASTQGQPPHPFTKSYPYVYPTVQLGASQAVSFRIGEHIPSGSPWPYFLLVVSPRGDATLVDVGSTAFPSSSNGRDENSTVVSMTFPLDSEIGYHYVSAANSSVNASSLAAPIANATVESSQANGGNGTLLFYNTPAGWVFPAGWAERSARPYIAEQCARRGAYDTAGMLGVAT